MIDYDVLDHHAEEDMIQRRCCGVAVAVAAVDMTTDECEGD